MISKKELNRLFKDVSCYRKEEFIDILTDLADYLVKKGMPFRSAYKITGELVAECIAKKTDLESLSLDEYKAHSELFEADLFEEISLETCVEKRISAGGTGKASAPMQIEYLKSIIA